MAANVANIAKTVGNGALKASKFVSKASEAGTKPGFLARLKTCVNGMWDCAKKLFGSDVADLSKAATAAEKQAAQTATATAAAATGGTTEKAAEAVKEVSKSWFKEHSGEIGTGAALIGIPTTLYGTYVNAVVSKNIHKQWEKEAAQNAGLIPPDNNAVVQLPPPALTPAVHTN